MTRTLRSTLLLGAACALAAPGRPDDTAPPNRRVEVTLLPAPAGTPPVARRHPHTLEIHGDRLSDDYFWMREKGTPEVEGYLNAELAYAEAFMKPTAGLQKKLYDEMLSRIQQTDISVPYAD
ncbi:MAG TPA: hypothetical protein VII13_13930, partial [Vicinamibacteria bacterium]